MKLNAVSILVWAFATAAIAAVPANALQSCQGVSEDPLVQLLPRPACETCPKTRVELDELLDIERTRTAKAEEHASADAVRTLNQFLAGTDLPFDKEALSACEDFFRDRASETKPAVEAAKDAFCRPRPFRTLGNALHPPAGSRPERGYSYPSGHAAYGAFVGFLLASMLPERAATLYNRVEDYAYSRMVLGVHFRSDVDAGKLIGAALAANILTRPNLAHPLAETKACVRRAAGLP